MIQVGKGVFFNHIKRLHVVIGFLASLSLIVSCGQPALNDDDASDLKHNLTEPTRNDEIYNWTSVTYEEFAKYTAPLVGIEGNFLPLDDEITKRAQFWVDALDTNLRSHFAAAFKNVPKPKALIIVNPDINAFVAPIPVCLDADIVFTGVPGKKTASRVFFDPKTGGFQNLDIGDDAKIACRDDSKAKDAEAVLKSLIATFNKTSTTQCRLTVTKMTTGSMINVPQLCPRSPSLAGVGRAKKIMFMRTAALVNIYSGILPTMTVEENFAGVVAHELGHYYRAHLTAETGFFGYFYQMTETNEKRRPAAGAAPLQALGKSAIEASDFLAAPYQKSDKLKVNSRMYLGMATTIQRLCSATTPCLTSCKEANELLQNSDYLSKVQTWPLRALSAEGAEAMKAFELKAQACLVRVKVAPGTPLTWASVLEDISNPSYIKTIFRNPSAQKAVGQWQLGIGALLPKVVPGTARDGWSAYAAASHTVDLAAAKKTTDLRAAFDKHLGHYTAEQEADEESIEWLAQLAINPNVAAATQLDLGKWVSENVGESELPLDLSYDACLSARKSGWRTGGAYNYIAVGNFADPHHSYCYRVFNIDREISAHNVVATKTRAPTPTGKTWKLIQKMAEDATGGIKKPGGKKGRKIDRWDVVGEALVKDMGDLSCKAFGWGLREPMILE